MNLLSSLAKELRNVLTDVAEKQGEKTDFIKRTKKLTGSLLIKGLVFAWLENADATVEELARSVSEQGVY